ncbi:MAG: ABC transporter permease [Hyphomicrobium sp.]|uniref:ABC transporter permease n=1 Tax=Hyphomicrobium sp. CS1BSMeth3 TaxID=1892844 RepID=UPI0009305B07|nr:ABC transporter permease [Hyphomicrobium sp. CS1BSMeth3]MBN9260060.1 ABC transporter permease [Hyphomicrobium sp.]MBN9267210.1 ABC transporter permease [Hyphomicrobium sp.]MBN9278270.1 ABC transporter permease [Hyphomicrobium sp.]OJU33266.1 MAG: peptide ABC transporter permease [Alphaproteobacteria bacterium 64-6]
MTGYIIRRLLLVIPSLIGVAVAVFFLIRVMPGDVVVVKLRADGVAVSEDAIIAERKRLGLDKSIGHQFVDYMWGLSRLDLGKSLWTGERVVDEIMLRFPVSLQIAIMATLIAVFIAIPLGTLSALYRDTWIDYTVRVVAVSGLAIPSFWLGMIIVLGLITVFGWLPQIGYVSIFENPWANLAALFWPALSVGYRYAAVATRMMRSALLEVMREDYIRTARAKGVFRRIITRRHAMRNAMLPVVTVIGLEFAFLIGGLVVTEQVFNINGIGKLFVDATTRGDFTLIQGLVLLIAVTFILVNLVVDLLYAWLDPRIRLS